MKIFEKIRAVIVFYFVMLSLSFSLMGQSLIQNIKSDSILKFNFPGMKIGVAENEDGPTGTTVFYFPDGVMGAADVRGGATGTVNASAVSRGYENKMIDAVVFSGGSWYGLSAATGAANEIKNIKTKEGKPDYIAGVLGGIIYDVGGRRFSRVTPNEELAKEALQNAKINEFPMGARGAGRFAMQGSYFSGKRDGSVDGYSYWPHSGQGGAYGEIGETKIAVFTIVNALGTVVDRNGNAVRCRRNFASEDCPTISEMIKYTSAMIQMDSTRNTGPTNNTTLTLVVTNQKLPFWAIQRLATQVHTSMGRAIQPFSTQYDGDVLYAVTTNEIENPNLSPMNLAVAASELAWDAVLNSTPQLPKKPILVESKMDMNAYKKHKGEYEFYGDGVLQIGVDELGLWAKFTGDGKIYFDENRTYRLLPAENGIFVIDAPAQDIIQFGENNITINPGPWAIRASRKN